MALTELGLEMASIKAAADLLKHRCVGLDGNYAPADGYAAGVLNADTKTGNMGPVAYKGVTIVTAKGVITAGKKVAVDADAGKVKEASALSVTVPTGSTPVTSDAAQPNLVEAGGILPQLVIGTAWDAAVNDGDLIRVKLD